MCEKINFPVSIEKTFWACKLLSFLGLLIDMVNQFVAIPIDKVQRAKSLIEDIPSKKSKKVTVHELQKTTGFLNFLCRAIIPGRAFLRRMYFYIPSNMKPHYHVRINVEMRQDLTTWLQFFAQTHSLLPSFLRFFTSSDS